MEARSMQESLLTWNREAYESLITLNGHQRYVIISMQIHLNSNNLVLFRYVKLCRLKWIKARISVYIWSLFDSYLFLPSFLFSPRGHFFLLRHSISLCLLHSSSQCKVSHVPAVSSNLLPVHKSLLEQMSLTDHCRCLSSTHFPVPFPTSHTSEAQMPNGSIDCSGPLAFNKVSA